MSPESSLKVDDRIVVNGGALITLGELDYSAVYIEGNVEVWSGHVVVTADGSYGALEVWGNFDIYGGTFIMNVSGGFGGESDQVIVHTGAIYFDYYNAARLHLFSDAVPDPLAAFVLFYGVDNFIVFDADFALFYWFGEYTGGYQHGVPVGPSYQLWL